MKQSKKLEGLKSVTFTANIVNVLGGANSFLASTGGVEYVLEGGKPKLKTTEEKMKTNV